MSTSVIILILTILAAFAAFFANKDDSNQKDRIENLVQEANKLAEKSKDLQEVNNSLSNASKKLVEENDSITKENLLLTSKTKSLVENVENLTSKVSSLLSNVHDEITGGNSIPIVQTEFRHLDYYKDSDKGALSPEGKWISNLMVRNVGKFPLTNIEIGRSYVYSREGRRYEDTYLVDNIRAGESKLMDIVSIDLLEREFPRTYTIRVKWKLEYYYEVTIFQNINHTSEDKGMFNIVYTKSEHYLFKGNIYQTSEDLIKAINSVSNLR